MFYIFLFIILLLKEKRKNDLVNQKVINDNSLFPLSASTCLDLSDVPNTPPYSSPRQSTEMLNSAPSEHKYDQIEKKTKENEQKEENKQENEEEDKQEDENEKENKQEKNEIEQKNLKNSQKKTEQQFELEEEKKDFKIDEDRLDHDNEDNQVSPFNQIDQFEFSPYHLVFQKIKPPKKKVFIPENQRSLSFLDFKNSSGNTLPPSIIDSLPESGIPTPETVKCISQRTHHFRKLLNGAGFVLSKKKFDERHIEIVQLIKSFQDTYRIFPSGYFSSETVKKLEEISKKKQNRHM